ncbi:MAG: methylmalonyl-CoA epimerase [Planctomycetota bacterium]
MSLDHVNIAARDATALAGAFEKLLGLRVVADETVEDQGVRLLKLSAGGTTIEITEPLSDDTPIGRFLEKRGPGLHHLAFEVPDVVKAIEHLIASGVRMVDETPRIGAGGHRIAFAHPSSFGGVLVELVEAS